MPATEDIWPIAARAGRRSMETLAHCSRSTQAEYGIPRYSLNASNENQAPMHPDHDGAWCRWVDVAVAMAQPTGLEHGEGI